MAGRKQPKRRCSQLRVKGAGRARQKCQTTVPVKRGAVSDNLNMIVGLGDEENFMIYEMQREIQSLRNELREQQWTPKEKYQHEARGHVEHNDRCEICVRVREQRL